MAAGGGGRRRRVEPRVLEGGDGETMEDEGRLDYVGGVLSRKLVCLSSRVGFLNFQIFK